MKRVKKYEDEEKSEKAAPPTQVVMVAVVEIVTVIVTVIVIVIVTVTRRGPVVPKGVVSTVSTDGVACTSGSEAGRRPWLSRRGYGSAPGSATASITSLKALSRQHHRQHSVGLASKAASGLRALLSSSFSVHWRAACFYVSTVWTGDAERARSSTSPSRMTTCHTSSSTTCLARSSPSFARKPLCLCHPLMQPGET